MRFVCAEGHVFGDVPNKVQSVDVKFNMANGGKASTSKPICPECMAAFLNAYTAKNPEQYVSAPTPRASA